MTELLVPIALAIIVAGAAWVALPFALRRRDERRLAAACRAQRAIVLSYDDGPGAIATPRLLALLAAHGARASFFALGRHIAARRATAAAVLAAGHELGSHSRRHLNAWKSDPVSHLRDTAAGVADVRALGADGRLYRPPYGKITLAGLVQAMAGGWRFAWWSVDTRDSWAPRPVADVLAEIEAKGGGVVLMHDGDNYGVRGGGSHPHGGHVPYMLAMTEGILGLAAEKGYRIRTLGEVLAQDRAPRARRVMAVASGGGHWVQLSRLRPAWDGCEVIYVTTDPASRAGVMADAAARGQRPPRFRTIVEANRWQKARLVRQLLQIAWIVLRARPDAIVTTGAAPGYFALRVGRLIGARTVWIDSIANADEVSLSGRQAGPHADLWLTQWPHLAGGGDGPDYRGAVL